MAINIRHTGRLDSESLASLTLHERAIHADGGFRRWELPIFAEYGRNYVLEVDGEFAGTAQLIRGWDEPDTAYLAGFGILAARQKQGLGVQFLRGILDEMAMGGIKTVELTVAPDNASALKLYEGLGFVKVAAHEDKYGPGEHRLVMRLVLSERTAG